MSGQLAPYFPATRDIPSSEPSPHPRIKVVHAPTAVELENKLNDVLDRLDEYATPQVSACTLGHSPAGWYHVVLVTWQEWR